MLGRQNELLCNILEQTASNFTLTSFGGSCLKVLENKCIYILSMMKRKLNKL